MARAGFTLGELAEVLPARLDGDPGRVVTGVAPLESAEPPSNLVPHRSPLPQRGRCVTGRRLPGPAGRDRNLPAPTLGCDAPQQALIELLRLFHPPVPTPAGVDRTAVVAPEARIDPSATVGPLCVVEGRAVIGARVRLHALVHVGAGVEIGDDSMLYPHVSLREGVRSETASSSSRRGARGRRLRFCDRRRGPHLRSRRSGGVLIEDDVEIGANTSHRPRHLRRHDRAARTKIDNLVQIGHNVLVGEHSLLVAQAGVSGSSRLGRGVILAGQVGVADHVTIGDGVIVGAQAGVPSDLAAGDKVLGTPAGPYSRPSGSWSPSCGYPSCCSACARSSTSWSG